MSSQPNRVFISYRRDDASGYAGRLEASLESRLGRGSAFRDVLDIAPGDDFVRVIGQRLAGAAGVVVLIGPRWAGGDGRGPRRIDDEHDFVRTEVAAALESGARVVPVLLPGATMPAESELPPALRRLARHNALPISDAHWETDVDRLVQSLALARRRAVWPWALGAVAAAAALAAVLGWPRIGTAPESSPRILGSWQASVRYEWGAQHTERFEFTRHAGQLGGTAGFLGYPRTIEEPSFDGKHLHFRTRSTESMGTQERELTHDYTAELRGTAPDEVLALRLQTSGGVGSRAPVLFEARRAAAAGPAPGARSR